MLANAGISSHSISQFHFIPQITPPLSPASLGQVTTILMSFPFLPLEKKASQLKLGNPAANLEAT